MNSDQCSSDVLNEVVSFFVCRDFVINLSLIFLKFLAFESTWVSQTNKVFNLIIIEFWRTLACVSVVKALPGYLDWRNSFFAELFFLFSYSTKLAS